MKYIIYTNYDKWIFLWEQYDYNEFIAEIQDITTDVYREVNKLWGALLKNTEKNKIKMRENENYELYVLKKWHREFSIFICWLIMFIVGMLLWIFIWKI